MTSSPTPMTNQEHIAQLAQRIRERREALGISQEEAAHAMPNGGVTARTWARWEAAARGAQDNSRAFLSRLPDIAWALNTTTDHLLAGLAIVPTQISLRDVMERLEEDARVRQDLTKRLESVQTQLDTLLAQYNGDESND